MIRAVLLLLAGLTGQARAEDSDTPALAGTLQVVHDRGVLRIGYRESAPPFSSTGPAGRPIGFSPIGFSIELCREVAADVAATLHQDLLEPGASAWQKGVRLQYIPVPPDQRLPMVMSGQIDLECGSTTANAERARSVGFSPVFFLAGTKLLVYTDSPILTPGDLAGHAAAAAAGTTNAELLRRVLPPTAKLLPPTIEAAYQMVLSGTADAMASDDVLLAGLIQSHSDGTRLTIVGDYLSYEPYALAFRHNDPAFAAVARASSARLAGSGRLERLYDEWVGGPLGLPMGPHLAEMYRGLGGN